MLELRPYQVDIRQALREFFRRGLRRVILQAETGSGKTVISADMLRAVWEKDNPALFIAHRRELVLQCSQRLTEHGVPHGLIMSRKPMSHEPIQVASKDTLLEWGVRGSEIELPPARLVIIDEAHLSLSPMWRKLLHHYRDAFWIGLTATPARGDGQGLNPPYQEMTCAIPPSQLIAQGYLVPTRVWAPYRPDLRGVRLSGHDYSRRHLAERIDQPQIVSGIVRKWLDLASDRLTIVFATTVEHSQHLVEAFRDAGVAAEHIDGKTHPDDREQILSRLWCGQTRVVCNVGVLPEGVDLPPVSCAVIARPTRSFVLWRQQAGRIKRPCRGKTDALLLDHAGAVFMHGHPDRDVPWTLAEGKSIQEVLRERGDPEPICCPKCSHVFFGRTTCPECGHALPKRHTKPVKSRESQMAEVDQDSMKTLEVRNGPEARIRHWHICLAVMAHKGRSAGAAAQMYRGRFGCFPEPFLPNRPGPNDWKKPVAQLFPQYLETRRKRKVSG